METRQCCSSFKRKLTLVTFENGAQHIKLSCKNCNKFVQYLPKSEVMFGEVVEIPKPSTALF